MKDVSKFKFIVKNRLVPNGSSDVTGYLCTYASKPNNELELSREEAIRIVEKYSKTKRGTNASVRLSSKGNKYLWTNNGLPKKSIKSTAEFKVWQSKVPRNIPKKERLAVRQLESFIKKDKTPIAILSGLRRVGKTTVLHQLYNKNKGSSVYIDLQEKNKGMQAIAKAIADDKIKLLLLDEITYLDDYDITWLFIRNMAANRKKRIKIIMTSSSTAHIAKLFRASLMSDMVKLFRIPPITFVEYLYITGRINSYEEYETATGDDFKDYLLLNGLNDELKITFDCNYFEKYYSDISIGNRKSSLTCSEVKIESKDIAAMASLLAYRINTDCRYHKTIHPEIGRQEVFAIGRSIGKYDLSDIDLSDTIISNRVAEVNKLTAMEKGRILSFLLWSGVANIEVKINSLDAETLDWMEVLRYLENCSDESQLRHLFAHVSICISTPLFYTRLGENILDKLGVEREQLCSPEILGRLYEIYVRGSYTLRANKQIMVSTKLNTPKLGEIDIYDDNIGLLCEASITATKACIRHKRNRLRKYFDDMKLIRVGSADIEKAVSDGIYIILPYAQLACQLDTGDVYKLPRTLGDKETC